MTVPGDETAQVDVLCKRLYESTSGEERAEAERALNAFSERADALQQCLLLLQAEKSAYSQLFASNTLTKLISKPASDVQLMQRVELRTYLLNYLVTHLKLPSFVLTSLFQLFSRVTKLGWFDMLKDEEFVFRTPIDEILKMTQEGSLQMCSVAVRLLGQIVNEMNTCQGFNSISRHRKVSGSFRDQYLYEIFTMTINMLQTAEKNIKSIQDQTQLDLVNQLLTVALACLTYDFIGSVIDDTSDETSSVQVPTTWRIAFTDCSIVQLFYSLYLSLPVEYLPQVFSCLVQLASIRRTIFDNAERKAYLGALTAGAKMVLLNSQNLSEQATYHEFCRLISRLKANYQLTELILVEDYSKLIGMLADFTVASLQMHSFAANSVHYLLSFWQRLVSSMPYVKAGEPHLLEQYAPVVAKAYVQSRYTLVEQVVVSGTMDDPLDDQASLCQQLEQLSVICRCDYEKTARLLLELFDQVAGEYQQLVTNQGQPSTSTNQHSATDKGSDQSQQLQAATARLTWLTFIIGAAIGGRVAFSTSDEHDLIDGDLICRVLELQRVTDSRLSVSRNEQLEHAYLWHLEQFRKIYISDQVQKTSKVYNRLASNLGLNDESAVLGVFVRKVITNLKMWWESERITWDSLALLNDLSIGYTSVRKLVQLPEIQFLLNNHTAEHFQLLAVGPAVLNPASSRSRSTFYTALTRLLCVDLADDDLVFQQFMMPLTASLTELSSAMTVSDLTAAGYDQEQIKRALIGLCRDVRGVAHACNSKAAFAMLFDWLYPHGFDVFWHALRLWPGEERVTSCVLKVMHELCHNRSQRLQFDLCSPNAILIFKQASRCICAFGSDLASRASSVAQEHIYKQVYKGIACCWAILKAVFSGQYVNFGVFTLYGDSCLIDALEMFIKLLFLVPQQEILTYTKLSCNYYQLLECIASDHVPFLSNLQADVFAYLLQTLHQGLTALDTMVCTGCSSTLELLMSYLYKRVSRQGKARTRAGMPAEGDSCLLVLTQHANICQQLLSTIINVLVFEDCRCQWSMSRPLLPLILLQEEVFSGLQQQIVRAQPQIRQSAFENAFQTLMDGVERTLSTKNRDRFTQNVSVFRRDVAEAMKNGVQPPSRQQNNGTVGDSMMN